MNSWLTKVLVLTLIAAAAFGVFGFHTGMNGHTGDCPAATVQGVACLQIFTPFDSALLVFTSLIALALILWRSTALRSSLPLLIRQRLRPRFVTPQALALTHWLAFHETSPTH